VRNARERGHPLYPVVGAPHYVDTSIMRPVNLTELGRVTRFIVAAFSTTEPVRPPRSTQLKFPLWIAPVEWRGVYGADTESGGFGPLYGALLLLATATALTLVFPRASSHAAAAVIVAACLMATMFVHTETWWARYVAQAWLIPMLFVAPALSTAPGGPPRVMGWGLAALATANVLIVGANVAWGQLVYARATAASLGSAAAAPQPVNVYVGPFRPMRRRLVEAGVRFRMHDEPPPSGAVAHPLPAPSNQAVWFE
jgi:hypothetical protein